MTDAATFRAIRERLGLTQGHAADALGVHIRTISNYESGSTRIPKAALMALQAMEATAQKAGRKRG